MASGARGPSEAPNDGSGAMFDTIAGRYDLLNQLTSFGLDRSWRRALVSAVDAKAAPPGAEILDVATGTADVALALHAVAPHIRVIGLDPSAAMLDQAAAKVRRLRADKRVELRLGIAEAMPFADGQFYAATMAFGIRNVPHRARALQELARVVRPGGTVAILELTDPPARAIGALARLWVHHAVPALGALLSGRGAYRYLSRSIAAFPPGVEFREELAQAGFVARTVRSFAFGSAHLFVSRIKGQS